MADKPSYRERMITFGAYLGYGEPGKALKAAFKDTCKRLNVSPSAQIRQLIQEFIAKHTQNQ